MILFDTTQRTARDQAMKAIRRGDLVAAERWFKLAERSIAATERLSRIYARDIRSEIDTTRLRAEYGIPLPGTNTRRR